MRYQLTVLSLVAIAYAQATASPVGAATPRHITTSGIDVLVSSASDSAASFETLPNARCVLSARGTKATMTVYADDRGSVPFHFTPARGGAPNGSIAAHCEARGNATDTIVRLHVVARAPRLLRPILASNARPLLPRGLDPATLGESALKRLQLPPRPDARRDPKNYTLWLRAVTTPVRRIGGSTILRSDIVHGPIARRRAMRGPAVGRMKQASLTSNNWSGIVDFGGSGQFAYWVAGQWTVPAVTTNEINSQAYSSVWDGIDGDGSGDVIQNGTEQDAFDIPFFGSFASYYGWYEFFPDGGSTTLPNFSVNPGDEIYAVSWLCYDGNNQRYGCYYMENMTQGEATPVYSELGQQPALFSGNSAEWIVERPTIGGNLYPLPDFNLVFLSWEHVYDSYAGAGYDSCSENQNSLMMFNGSDLLSEGIPTGCDSSLVFWDGFQ